MPKTRTSQTKAEKAGEILAVAERQLRENGYEGLSVAAIARELGLAQNAVYWYFPSRDHLFVAALRHMLQDIAARKPRGSQDTTQRILWFTDQFAALSNLRAAMTERARVAPIVAEFVADLEATLARMLGHAFEDQIPPERLALAVESFRATVEGTFARGLTRNERRRVLTYTIEQLTRG